MNLDDWRRRLALAHWLVDQLLAGERIWMKEELGRIVPCTMLDRRPGVVFYDIDPCTGALSARFRIVGTADDSVTD